MSERGIERKRVVIIGGGLAGLSAAEALARGYRDQFEITLLEAKHSTGGRAGSFIDRANGETVDYCQHVAMGCCTNLIGLLERCGLSESMQRYTELQFLHPGHAPSRFAPSTFLPAPLHLARTISGLHYLTRTQRGQVRRGWWRLLRSPSGRLNDQVAMDWLRDHGQDAATIQEFWNVIVVSALGERVDRVSMSAVRKVFVDGFAAAHGASDVLVPKLPLSELFGHQLCRAIENLQVRVLNGESARNIEKSEANATIETKDGERHEADHVIVAVPWHGVGSLLSPEQLPDVEQISQFPASSITGVHLWLDRQITDLPHAVLVGTVAQWLFRQPWKNDHSPNNGYYYQVVISASQHARSLPKEQLVETLLDELRHAFPAARDASLLRSRIVTDPNSVFSIRPEVEAYRPPARTSLPWLHLAGDWIATGWPATMEGAVISGRMAASSITEREGLAPINVDNGLPQGWLAAKVIKS